MSEKKKEPVFTIGSTMYFDENKSLDFSVGNEVVVTMGDQYDIHDLQFESVPLETMRDFLQKTLEIIDSAIKKQSDWGAKSLNNG